jgi:accessory gene regulator B
MFRNSAKKLVGMLITNGVILENDSEIYCYGFEIGFSVLANILTTLSIGMMLGMTIESLCFLLAFVPLRSYAGGFHTSNHFRCYWLSSLAVLITLIASRFFLTVYNETVIIWSGIIFVFLMFILVPVQDSKRRLDEIEIIIFRRRARIVLSIDLLLLFMLLAAGLKSIVSILICTLCLTSVSTCGGALIYYYTNK